ncbi:hypothetical protein [Rhizobium sp. NFR03]|nr:hypothetical protein [Rhizobium sp. NFR03]SES47451.1 hypothetical protein SAMN03159406_05002 [Rhizobium sp. NFR03]
MIEFRPKTPAELKRDTDNALRAAVLEKAAPVGKKTARVPEEPVDTP